MKKLIYVLPLLLVSIPSFADGHMASGVTDVSYVAFAKALGIALAVIGAATAQGKAASTALDGIARNPAAAGKIQTPMIIALALMEALAILAFVVVFTGF